MKFIVYGLNHVTAPISVRERYALPQEKIEAVLKNLKTFASEAVILSTCNRVEFYLSTEREEDCLTEIHRILNSLHRLKPPEFKKYFYLYEDSEAYLHLFRVASSLDSMVVGEAQILGQAKESYQLAHEAGMAGATMNSIFHRAFSAAKRVRSQTEIARMPVSVPSITVKQARKIFSQFSEHHVLLLGAGEMSELTVKYLIDAGVKNLLISNRTLKKAQTLAARLGGKALSLSEGLGKISQVDILMTSIGGRFKLRRRVLEAAMATRKGKPLFIIDIGVPRNVDPEVGDLEGVHLYNIDDLAAIAETNQRERQKAVLEAEAILREEADELSSWISSRKLAPTIVRLREHFEGIRRAELEEFHNRHKHLPEKERKAVEKLTQDMVAKLLHNPSVNLKKIPYESDKFDYARMLNEIFLNQKHPDHD